MWPNLTLDGTGIENGFLAIGIQATIAASLLFVVAAVSVLLARGSAAARHRVWSLALGGSLAVAILVAVAPPWRVPVLPARSNQEVALRTNTDEVTPPAAVSESVPVRADIAPLAEESGGSTERPLAQDVERRTPTEEAQTAGREDEGAGADSPPVAMNRDPTQSTADAPKSSPIDAEVSGPGGSTAPTASNTGRFGAWAAAVWAAGFAWCLLVILIGAARGARLRLKTRPLHEVEWTALVDEARTRLGIRRAVRLLTFDGRVVPMTWGVLRPVVVLPNDAASWSTSRRRMVLLHELAHIRRLDLPQQWVARAACAVHWFNPLAWVALSRLRIERERACDDCVVAAGERASDYAAELVAIAETHARPRLSAAVAMIRSSQLEDRLTALFDQSRSHSPLRQTTAGAQLVLFALLVATTALVRPVPQTASALSLAEPPADSTGETKSAIVDGNQSEPTVTIRGLIVNEVFRPVADAEVFVETGPDTRVSTRSDTEGRYEIILPADTTSPVVVWAQTESGRRRGSREARWDEARGVAEGVGLELRPIQRIVVDVHDAEGNPVGKANATIAYRNQHDRFSLRADAETDTDGHVEWLLPHDAAIASVYAYADFAGLDFEEFDALESERWARINSQKAAEGNEPVTRIGLALDGADPVRVRVVESDGTPAPGVAVRTSRLVRKPETFGRFYYFSPPASVITDVDGYAEFNWFPAWSKERISFSVSSPDYGKLPNIVRSPNGGQRGTTRYYDPETDEGSFTITVERFVPVRGRVTFPGGDPAAGINVRWVARLLPHGRGSALDTYGRKQAITDEEGRYEFKVPPNQHYLVMIDDDRWGAPAQHSFEVLPGQPAENVDFVLQPATRIHGRVTVGADRKPVSGKRIVLDQNGPEVLPTGSSSALTNNRIPSGVALPSQEKSLREPTRVFMDRVTKTHRDGYYELFVGPGRYKIIGPSADEIEDFEIGDEREREFNFHRDEQ